MEKKLEKIKAKLRQGTRTDIVENLPLSNDGKSRDKASEGLKATGRTLGVKK